MKYIFILDWFIALNINIIYENFGQTWLFLTGTKFKVFLCSSVWSNMFWTSSTPPILWRIVWIPSFWRNWNLLNILCYLVCNLVFHHFTKFRYKPILNSKSEEWNWFYVSLVYDFILQFMTRPSARSSIVEISYINISLI
jgi:hypothetical protein